MGTIEVTKSGDSQPFESYELEMIATMSAVSRSIPKHGWTIQNSPFIRQEPKMILDQLLMKWTTLGDSQVREILVGGFEDTKKPYGGANLAFDVDSDTDSEGKEDEEGGTNLGDGDDSQTTTYGSPNKPPTPPKNDLERPWAGRKGHVSWEDEMRSYGKTRRQDVSGKLPGPFDPKHEKAKKPPFRQDDQAAHPKAGFRGDGSRDRPYTRPFASYQQEDHGDSAAGTDYAQDPQDNTHQADPSHRQRRIQYVSPGYAGPQYAGPQYANPYYGSSQYASPQSAGPQYTNPQDASSQYASPQYASPQYTSPQYASSQYASPQYQAQNTQWGAHMPWYHAQPYNSNHGYPTPYISGYGSYYAPPYPVPYSDPQPQQAQQASSEVEDIRRKLEEIQAAMANQQTVHERKRTDSPRGKWLLEMEREWERRKEQEALKERVARAEAIEMQQRTLRQQEDERQKLRDELLREREREEEDKKIMFMKLEAEVRAKINAENQQQQSERRQFHLEMEHEKAMERLWRLRQSEHAPKVESWEITTEPDHGSHHEATQQAKMQEHQARLIGEVQALAESLRRQQAELQEDIRKLHVGTTVTGADPEANEVKEDFQMQKTRATQPLPGALAYQVFDDSEGEQWDEEEDEEDEVSSDDSRSDISQSDGISVVDTYEGRGQVRHGGLRIPCSRPWKGPAGILPFTFSNISAHILPVYIRGNGESLFNAF